MTTPSVTVRVSAVRSQNPYGWGGAIFTGVEVDDKGLRSDAKTHYVIMAPSHLLQTDVQCGQWWRVEGAPEANTIVVNGYRLTEFTITPEAMELLRPSGEHVIALLAEGEAFEGIGLVKARRLWEHFGDDLYRVLDTADIERLVEILPESMAQKLADAWHHWGDTFTLQWLQSKGFPVALGRKVLAFYGHEAARKIEDDPYRLISFAADWKTTDALALGTFGLATDDPRRLAGAVEETLYAGFDAGHTCLTEKEFTRRLRLLLNSNEPSLVANALAEAEASNRFIRRHGRLHAPGPYVMEHVIAEAIAVRAADPDPLLGDDDLATIMNDYQAEADLTLHERQIEALKVANANRIVVITGGAGTGKTTVLRGLFRIAQAAGWAVYPMALSGRAAKRIGEATGHPAQTIAGFLKRIAPNNGHQRAIVVIDEASMVDLPSAYRIICHLPSTYRFVLVGDPHQLPPVGPGLLLHELAHQGSIPMVELVQVKRYGGAIAEAAAAIRQGEWPGLAGDPQAPIAFIPCGLDQINDTVLRLYDEDREASQILCATRHAAAGGVMAINALCQHHANREGEELMLWNQLLNQRQRTGLRVGDPVICLKNDWEIDLQNGSLGTILSVEPPVADPAPGRVVGRILWDDGKVRDLTTDLLPDLELAYAITIHKAQGSQFRRIIIPVRKSRLLDRTLLYTAVTRAQQQVILVGDVKSARVAVEAPPHAARRQVAMGSLLNEIIGGMA